jgi:hypothetical protein
MLQAIQNVTASVRPYQHYEAPTEVESLVAPVYLPLRWFGKPPETTLLAEVLRSPHALTEPEFEVSPPEEPSRTDKLHAELLSYCELPHGWDGYEGVPASLNAVLDAFSFLRMQPEDVPLPYAQIGPDGEVGLYWRTEDVCAEVSFYGDGECSYYACYSPLGGQPIEDGQDGYSLEAENWPAGLLLILNKIAS